LGPALAPVERWAALLADRLKKVLDEHADAGGVDLVAHSMGGLVVRVLLEKYPEVGRRVHTLVTLGTPHDGTAVIGKPVLWQSAAQMIRGSSFLRELPYPTDAAPQMRVVTFGAVQDYIVYPAETCRLEGAPHHLLDVGHAGLVASSRSIERVVEALTESEDQR
jgi:pimeloyl-ACP methyl ester carboxylesterase